MKRTPLRRTTHLRSIGAKAKRLRAGWEASKKIVFVRAGGKCENPWCHKPGRDYHHIVKRSQGRDDSPLNLVALCRACHNRLDLPTGQKGHLDIETFVDDLCRKFAIFSGWSMSEPVLLGSLPDAP